MFFKQEVYFSFISCPLTFSSRDIKLLYFALFQFNFIPPTVKLLLSSYGGFENIAYVMFKNNFTLGIKLIYSIESLTTSPSFYFFFPLCICRYIYLHSVQNIISLHLWRRCIEICLYVTTIYLFIYFKLYELHHCIDAYKVFKI